MNKSNDLAFIFDFDGTIADTLPTVIEIARDLNKTFKLYDAENIDIEKFRNMSTQDFFRSLGLPMYKVLYYILKFQKRLKNEMMAVPIFPGLIPVLEEIHNRGITTGIITSHPADEVADFLKRHEISHLFSFTESVFNPFGKGPILVRIIKKLNLNKECVYYIGDETRDIETARVAQVNSISVTWGYHFRDLLLRFKPDYIVEQPSELLSLPL